MHRRFWITIFPVLLVVASGIAVASILYYNNDYSSKFKEEKGKLESINIQDAASDPLNAKSWLTLTNDRNLTVECGMLTPRASAKRVPAVILLGGKATGKYAIDYAMDIRDVIIIAVDYPYEPRESYTIPQFASDVPAIRRALLDMVPSVMLVTDYLWTRPDVDTSRIVLLGYSFGAPFVPCLIANDHRPAAAAMVYGGGDLRSLISHNVQRYESRGIAALVGFIGGILLRPLEPLRYAKSMTPTPLIMINGLNDEQVPRRNAELLFEEAREPKRQIWLESGHVNPRNPQLTRQIIAVLKIELVGLGVLEPEAEDTTVSR